MEKPKVFISYAHKDKNYFDIFHANLKSQSGWDIWTDRNIEIGTNWFESIQQSMQQSDAAVLLISPDFFSSDFIKENEFNKFNELKESKPSFVFLPIFLRDCDFSRWTELSKLQMFDSYGDEYGIADKKGELVPFSKLCRFDNNGQLVPNDFIDTYIKNLVIKAKTELNRTKSGAESDGNKPVNAKVPVKNSLNEVLTKRLMEAIKDYSPKARTFLENVTRMAGGDWETKDKFSELARETINFSFVGVLGIQLKKLMVIGKSALTDEILKNYLENCVLTSKRALQLICFTLISRLWDHQLNDNYKLSDEQKDILKNFFENVFEPPIYFYAELMKTLIDIFSETKPEEPDLPIPELSNLRPALEAGSGFMDACLKLQTISDQLSNEQLPKSALTEANCKEAEEYLTVVLENLNFLVLYKMMSVKNIGYMEVRNSKAHYLHNYTALGIDSKSNSINLERISYSETPINSDAVLLYKGNFQQNTNLFPFIIDVNAMKLVGGSKICFYSSYNNRDGSLNYSFFEDNSIENIKSTKTWKPDTDINDFNKLLVNPGKLSDMKFDIVINQFREAKKWVTGIVEYEETEDS